MIRSSWLLYIFIQITAWHIFMSATDPALIWLCLESRTFAYFVYFITRIKTLATTKTGLIKYIAIQTAAGLPLLPLLIVNPASLTTSLLLILKLGIIPLHHWLISLIIKTDINKIYLLLTWQKLIPTLTLLSKRNRDLRTLMGIFNMGLSSLLTLRLQNINVFLLISCTNITGFTWVRRTYYFEITLAIFHFYMLSILPLILCLNTIKPQFKEHNIVIIILLLSSGLPPFTSFFIKIMVIYKLSCHFYLISIILIGLNSFFIVTILKFLLELWKKKMINHLKKKVWGWSQVNLNLSLLLTLHFLLTPLFIIS